MKVVMSRKKDSRINVYTPIVLTLSNTLEMVLVRNTPTPPAPRKKPQKSNTHTKTIEGSERVNEYSDVLCINIFTYPTLAGNTEQKTSESS